MTVGCFENKKSTNTTRKSDKEESLDLFDMSPQDGDEKSKRRYRIKNLTPRKLLTKILILLAAIKVGKIHTNQKMKSDKYHIFWKSLQQLKQVIIIMEENMTVIIDPKNFDLILIDLKMLMQIWSTKLN